MKNCLDFLQTEAARLIQIAEDLENYYLSPERYFGMVTEFVRLVELAKDGGLIESKDAEELFSHFRIEVDDGMGTGEEAHNQF